MWQMVWLPLTARELWSLTNPAKFYCFFTQKASRMMILMETMFCWMQPTNLYSLTLVKKAKARILKPKVDIKDVCKRYSHIAPELHRGDRQKFILLVLRFNMFKRMEIERIAKKCLSFTPGKCPQTERCFKRTGDFGDLSKVLKDVRWRN